MKKEESLEKSTLLDDLFEQLEPMLFELLKRSYESEEPTMAYLQVVPDGDSFEVRWVWEEEDCDYVH